MVTKEASSRSTLLNKTETDRKLFTDIKQAPPQISFEEAQAIVHKVITHINTGRGRVWSKLTAA